MTVTRAHTGITPGHQVVCPQYGQPVSCGRPCDRSSTRDRRLSRPGAAGHTVATSTTNSDIAGGRHNRIIIAVYDRPPRRQTRRHTNCSSEGVKRREQRWDKTRNQQERTEPEPRLCQEPNRTPNPNVMVLYSVL